jgi:hypothetical protein
MEVLWDKKDYEWCCVRTLTNTGPETRLPLPIHSFHYTSFFRTISTNLQTVKKTNRINHHMTPSQYQCLINYIAHESCSDQLMNWTSCPVRHQSSKLPHPFKWERRSSVERNSQNIDQSTDRSINNLLISGPANFPLELNILMQLFKVFKQHSVYENSHNGDAYKQCGFQTPAYKQSNSYSIQLGTSVYSATRFGQRGPCSALKALKHAQWLIYMVSMKNWDLSLQQVE